MKDNEKNKVSKLLSLVLRHKPEEIGLTLDNEGWTSVNNLIEKINNAGVALTYGELREVVDTNDKKRFVFSDDFSMLRAYQGHSIDVDLKLVPAIPPLILFHGTAEKNMDSILEKGILRQDRNYVHLSADIETANIVGKRYGKPIVFEVMSKDMFDEGIYFYQTNNLVWLTDNIHPKYIRFKKL
jgi:putative RNA 2'-phosphotransferase